MAAEPSSVAPKPDNSAANSAPLNSTIQSATADGQSNESTDLTITRKIRESVMADKHLSTYAHNAKIVVVNGTVTLNGVVRSEEEKRNLAMKAEAVAGKDKVTNYVTVAPKN